MSSTAFVTAGPGVFIARPQQLSTCQARPATSSANIITMAKQAKIGPFTPAVVAAKLVLGDKSLNKVRGKAIKYHSQAITKFCEVAGADRKTKQDLIKLAKDNGNVLGFLY